MRPRRHRKKIAFIATGFAVLGLAPLLGLAMFAAAYFFGITSLPNEFWTLALLAGLALAFVMGLMISLDIDWQEAQRPDHRRPDRRTHQQRQTSRRHAIRDRAPQRNDAA